MRLFGISHFRWRFVIVSDCFVDYGIRIEFVCLISVLYWPVCDVFDTRNQPGNTDFKNVYI